MAAFPVSGALIGYTTIPTLNYQDNIGNWLALPTGASVTITGFSFIHPGITVTGNYVVSVRDTNAPSVIGSSASFTVSLRPFIVVNTIATQRNNP